MSVESASFLVEKFEDFFREVNNLAKATSGGARPPAESGLFSLAMEPRRPETVRSPAGSGAGITSFATPSSVRQRLLSLLERQMLDVRRSGGDYAAALYKEAQYIMAAVADEVFLYLDWSGSEDWSSHILESQLFGSHRAGEEIFDEIERHLNERNPVYVDLAKVYLMALSVGFQGKFRGTPDGPQQLASYRKRLMEFISGEEPELREGGRLLVPEAYANTLDQGMESRLPYLKLWAWVAIGVVLVWLLASHFLWRRLVSPLEPDIQTILRSS